MTQRLKIARKVDTIDVDNSKLTDLVDRMKSLIEEYGDGVYISREEYDYSDDFYYVVMVIVPETDEEMATRIEHESIRAAILANPERKEYERLKAKFG
jgi:siroheme synthase (precorrin-2 oxidase/ferrochelatase)